MPSLGRWLSRDPIGERGGLNLYGFVQNNPGNNFDVYGLITLAEFKRRSLSFVGGTSQLVAGLSFIGVGTGSLFGTGGLSAPIAIGAVATGSALVTQGLNNVYASVSEDEVNFLRTKFEYLAKEIKLAPSTGTKIYYGTEIFTGVISISSGVYGCGKIIFTGTKTVQTSVKTIHPFQPGGATPFVETLNFTRNIKVNLVTQAGIVTQLFNDAYQLNLAADGLIEVKE